MPGGGGEACVFAHSVAFGGRMSKGDATIAGPVFWEARGGVFG